MSSGVDRRLTRLAQSWCQDGIDASNGSFVGFGKMTSINKQAINSTLAVELMLIGENKVTNTASAEQRMRNSARKAVFNNLHRSRARTAVKATRNLIAKKDLTGAQAELLEAISLLDKAAGKGVIHPNNAARRKSRLMKLMSKATKKSS
jgi:small subunit ribosomal protein S20